MATNEKQDRILATFVNLYCQQNHGPRTSQPCPKCSDLLAYAQERLANCPYDPKPKCKNCRTHCYAEPYRSRIKEVMKFSGIYFVKRGRLDWLLKYFLAK